MKIKKNPLLLDKLRKLRGFHNMKKQYLANQLGMKSAVNYYQYEIGDSLFTEDHVKKLAQIYKVPYEFLVNDTKKIDIENLLGYKEELVINSKKGAEILLKTLKNFNSYSKKTQNLIEEFLERVLYFEEKNDLDNTLDQTKKIKFNYIST